MSPTGRWAGHSFGDLCVTHWALSRTWFWWSLCDIAMDMNVSSLCVWRSRFRNQLFSSSFTWIHKIDWTQNCGYIGKNTEPTFWMSSRNFREFQNSWRVSSLIIGQQLQYNSCWKNRSRCSTSEPTEIRIVFFSLAGNANIPGRRGGSHRDSSFVPDGLIHCPVQPNSPVKPMPPKVHPLQDRVSWGFETAFVNLSHAMDSHAPNDGNRNPTHGFYIWYSSTEQHWPIFLVVFLCSRNLTTIDRDRQRN